MKNLKSLSLIILLVVLFTGNAFGQTPYNPFTQNIHFLPEPTAAGFACGSSQNVVFTMGMTTSANATQWQNNPLTVVICLTGFKFNGPVTSAVTGAYAANFDWAYDSFAPGCIIGTQKQTLHGTGGDPIFPDPLSSGDIKLAILVPEVSPISTILSVNVNLQVPGYMSQFNSAPDDNEATQTQTYCALRIGGTIFNDRNGDANVNGTPIASPNGIQLYAHLLGSNDNVLAIAPVAASGNYEFLNVTPNTNYSVLLSTVIGTIGSPAPATDLPTTWVNTGEDCCDQVGNDGNPNGIVSIAVTNFSKIHVDFGIKDPTATGLPVILKNFFVSEYNCGGLLSWTTSQEENTSHVEIYRKDGAAGALRKIATVASAGMSHTEKIYSYTDKDVNPDMTYEYQLKFIDIDAQFTNSDIKTLKINCSKTNTSINLFPNPATSELNILYVTESDNVELGIEIMDIAGRTIMTKSQSVKNGGNLITLDINSIASGTYVLHYHDTDGTSVGSIKFIKQ